MSGKKVEYILQYRDKKGLGYIKIPIDFISNYVLREYGDIVTFTGEIRDKWERMQELTEELKTAENKQPIESEIKAITDEIKGAGSYEFLQRRFKLIKQILSDNYIEDTRLFDFDFWDKKVDPAEMIIFLSNVVYKDIDFSPKKKVMQ